MKVTELQQRLQSFGVKSRGLRKAELQARLRGFLSANPGIKWCPWITQPSSPRPVKPTPARGWDPHDACWSLYGPSWIAAAPVAQAATGGGPMRVKLSANVKTGPYKRVKLSANVKTGPYKRVKLSANVKTGP